MNFAITASDRYLGVWQSFVAKGWKCVKLFTTPVDNRLHHNRKTLQYAESLGVEAQISPMTDQNLAQLGDAGCDALIVASYGWRIGDWRRHLGYAVNFHPSPLPLGRGGYPTPRAILDAHKSWAVTCHQIDAGFDSGPILASRHFPLSMDECHESLDFKIQMASRVLADDVAANFSRYWSAAQPQCGDGSYFKLWSAEDRTLDLTQTVVSVMRRIRAFGTIECIATINDVTIHVQKAVGWEEGHDFRPGSLVQTNALQMLVAVKDGFVGIVEWSMLPPELRSGNPPR